MDLEARDWKIKQNGNFKLWHKLKLVMNMAFAEKVSTFISFNFFKKNVTENLGCLNTALVKVWMLHSLPHRRLPSITWWYLFKTKKSDCFHRNKYDYDVEAKAGNT